MGRGTLSNENIEHQPKLGFIKINVDDAGKVTKVLKTIKLKIKPASEVFDLVKKEEEKKENEEIETFVEKLATETSKPAEENDVTVNMDMMKIAKDIKEKALYYIQEARLAKQK